MGASVIKCGWAARGIPRAATLTARVVSKSANKKFFDARKTILNETISLNVSHFLVNPTCWAGVLTLRPKFNAR